MRIFSVILALHLGALHPVEKLLTVVLAIVPFVVLGIVIVVQRRRDDAAEEAGNGADLPGATTGPDGPDGPED